MVCVFVFLEIPTNPITHVSLCSSILLSFPSHQRRSDGAVFSSDHDRFRCPWCERKSGYQEGRCYRWQPRRNVCFNWTRGWQCPPCCCPPCRQCLSQLLQLALMIDVNLYFFMIRNIFGYRKYIRSWGLFSRSNSLYSITELASYPRLYVPC